MLSPAPFPWISAFVFGHPKAKLSYTHKIAGETDASGAPGSQVALATDVEVGLGQEGLESTTRMGWNYQLRCDPAPT